MAEITPEEAYRRGYIYFDGYDDNIQLGAGQSAKGFVMAGSDQILGGDVSTNFKFGKVEDYSASIEACRLEQEAVCGYPLILKSTRQSHYDDEKGNDVYEVFATFGPAPAPVSLPADATQA